MTIESNYLSFIHLIERDGKFLAYHPATDTILKVPASGIKISNNTYSLNDACKKQLLSYLYTKQTTSPVHSFWKETKTLEKLTLIVSTTCNMICSYCYASEGKYAGYDPMIMTPESAEKIINYYVSFGVNTINNIMFFGGEPWLAPVTINNICEYVTGLYNKHILTKIPTFSMVTNLTILSDEIINIIEKYNIQMTVSIDGIKDIHDMQRITKEGGTFNRIQENFKLTRKHIIAIEATYTMNHIKNNISVDQLKKQLSFDYSIELQHINVVPVIGCKELSVDPIVFHDFLENNDTSDQDVHILSAFNNRLQSDLLCNTGFSSAAVFPNGDIYPCHMYAINKKYCIGNIKDDRVDYQSLSQIVSIAFKNTHDECMSCWAYKFCHICPAKNLFVGAASQISELQCNERKKRYEQILHKAVYGETV